MPPYSWEFSMTVSRTYFVNRALGAIEDNVPLEHVIIILKSNWEATIIILRQLYEIKEIKQARKGVY